MYLPGLLLGLALVLPCVLLYLLFIRGMDRFEPEPLWLLAIMFCWGAFGATFISVLGSAAGEGAIRWALDPGADEALVAASTSTFVAPVVEETTKGFGLLVLWLLSGAWLKELDGPLDGVVFGGCIGLGFTLTEDVLYLASAMNEGGLGSFGGLFVARTLFAGLGHASFTAVLGLGIGLAVISRHPLLKLTLPVVGWIGAVSLHAFHNLLLTFLLADGLGFFAKLVLFWFFDLLFFALVVVLVIRDRSIVLRGLSDEVGKSLDRYELERTTSWWMTVPLWNRLDLGRLPAGYRRSRRKQVALIELAFLKHRRERGETGLDAIEHRLRKEIEQARKDGVIVG